MTNEEFQKIVIEELRNLNIKVGNLEEKVGNLEEKVGNLDQKVGNLEQGQIKLEQGQKEIRKDLKSVIEQTADLTEFREEINAKVDKVIEELNTLEIVTSKNWYDIAKLKSAK